MFRNIEYRYLQGSQPDVVGTVESNKTDLNCGRSGWKNYRIEKNNRCWQTEREPHKLLFTMKTWDEDRQDKHTQH